jgi:ABC-type antimicrobial peptide transport system permease subunit
VAYLALPYVAQLLDVRLTRTALLSPEVLSFLLLLAGLTTLLAGFYPALVLSGYQPVQALKSKVRTAGNGQMYLRRSLIVLQFAISQLLLIGTIVAYSQMKHFRSANLGYNKEAIFTVSIPDRQPKDIAALRAKLAGLPAIASMSFGISAPSSPNNWGTNFRLEGWDKGAPYEVIMRIADTAYFQTYGLQLVAGRLYLPADTIREFVVNETFARKLGYSDPSKIIGRRMHLHSDVAKPIVGVVKDFSLFTLHKQNQPCVLTTLFWAYNKLGIKLAPQAGTEAISQTLAEVERVWTATFPNNVFKYELLDQALNDFYKTEERLYGLFRLLSGIAIFIGCLGLYGVVAFMVESRTKEVGIRKTLGASANDIFAIFSLDFVRLVLIALVLASPLAWYVMNRWLEDFAHKIKIEWWVFALTGLLAVGISLLTVSLQSIKAARMNPVKSLRAE